MTVFSPIGRDLIPWDSTMLQHAQKHFGNHFLINNIKTLYHGITIC